MDNEIIFKVISNRFFRAFISGFVSSIATMPLWGGNFNDLYSYAVAVLIAGVAGGIMAVDKAIRWKE